MLGKFANLIFGGCLLLGFVVMVGTAGASDCEAIGITRIVIQGLVSLILMGVGVCGLNLVETGYLW